VAKPTAEGKTKPESFRCRERDIARQVYELLVEATGRSPLMMASSERETLSPGGSF